MVEVIWEETGVLRRLTGVVTLKELDASGAQLQGHERTDSLRYIIHDFSGCEEVDADRSGIEYLVARA
ncbi:MAG: hypothetical protein JNM82_10645, partial [Rhodocyclaceae bacterium]|nr:hypothetical protein [Rhodocyclaceae bacterium]